MKDFNVSWRYKGMKRRDIQNNIYSEIMVKMIIIQYIHIEWIFFIKESVLPAVLIFRIKFKLIQTIASVIEFSAIFETFKSIWEWIIVLFQSEFNIFENNENKLLAYPIYPITIAPMSNRKFTWALLKINIFIQFFLAQW